MSQSWAPSTATPVEPHPGDKESGHWKRIKPGQYRFGAYLVGQLDTGEWFAEGPGVDRCFDHKSEAQAACAAARNHVAPPATSARASR